MKLLVLALLSIQGFAPDTTLAGSALLAAGMAAQAQTAQEQELEEFPQELIDHAFAVGALSGTAEACGLEWQSHRDAFVELHRRRGMDELSLMFIRAYHAAAQDDAKNHLEGHCDDAMRELTQSALDTNMHQLRE